MSGCIPGTSSCHGARSNFAPIFGMLMRPAALGGEGYGLPQQERDALQARAAELSMRVKADWQDLHQAARDGLPSSQREALAGIEKNLATLGTRLRELNRTQGGLQLPGAGAP